MSLLTIIQDAAYALGQGSPDVVVTSTDETVLELLALSNTSGEALASDYDFPELKKEATFSATGNVDQGQFLGSAGVVSDGDYLRMVPDTFWDRTIDRPIIFPVTDSEWAQLSAFNSVPTNKRAIILNRNLHIGPNTGPSSGNTLAFTYYGSKWCASASGTAQSEWAADTDVGIIPERILKLDLIWRWKQSKYLPYAEDLETAERAISSHTGAAGGRRLLILGGQSGYNYVTNIPEGNWGQ